MQVSLYTKRGDDVHYRYHCILNMGMMFFTGNTVLNISASHKEQKYFIIIIIIFSGTTSKLDARSLAHIFQNFLYWRIDGIFSNRKILKISVHNQIN